MRNDSHCIHDNSALSTHHCVLVSKKFEKWPLSKQEKIVSLQSLITKAEHCIQELKRKMYRKRVTFNDDSNGYSVVVTLVIIHLFLIINTLVCFWQVKRWSDSALHYAETGLKKTAIHCSQVHLNSEYSGRTDALNALLQSFNQTSN